MYRKDSSDVDHSLIWMNFDYLDLPEFRTQSEIFSSNTVIGNDADTGSANKISLLQNYSYDGNSFITGITTQRTQNSVTTTKIMQYSYDEAGQLIRVNDEAGNRTYTYKYDAGGNISEKKEYAFTIDPDDLGSTLVKYSFTYDDTWKDKLINYDFTDYLDSNNNFIKAITYPGTNDIGNPSTYDGWTYTWQAGRQLAGMSKAGTSIGYTYNASGLRTSKTVNDTTTNYTLVGSQITHEKTNTAQMDYYYDGNGQLVSICYNGNMYYYLHNILGEITGLVDGNGNLVVEYTYDPYGKVLATTGSAAATLGAANPFRYKDYYLDGETGLFYVGSRYYDPEVGRWLSPEPNVDFGEFDEGAGLLAYNVYTYCANNPIMYVDHTGEAISLIACVVIGAVAGLVLGGTAGAVISYKKFGKVKAKYVFIGAAAGAAIGAAAGYAIGIAIGASVTTATTAKGFASVFKISSKISGQMAKRGWTNKLIKDTILKNVGRKAFNKATGNAATAYFTSSGAYVVIDNITKQIVQISNRFDPNWVVDATIKLLKGDVFIK